MEEMHLYLRDASSGDASEPVHAVPLGGSNYRVVYSPSIVYGIAAGDEIDTDAEGNFSVLRRGGNLAVRVLCAAGVDGFADDLCLSVEGLGGRLDGKVRNGLVFTIPLEAGFEAIERLFGEFTSMHSSTVWEYGNVYNEAGQPLLWWRNEV